MDRSTTRPPRPGSGMVAKPQRLNAGRWGFRFHRHSAPSGLLRSELLLHSPVRSLGARTSAIGAERQMRPARRQCQGDRDPGIGRPDTDPECRPTTLPLPTASLRGIPSCRLPDRSVSTWAVVPTRQQSSPLRPTTPTEASWSPLTVL